MEQYKIDFMNKTLIVSAAFEKAMQDTESAEYKLFTTLQYDIKGLKVSRRTHKTPTRYHAASGEVFRCNPCKRLTYENMERFMSGLQQKDELMEVYRFIRNYAALPQASRYAAVRRWFSAQFPLLRKNPLIYYNNNFEVITEIKPFIEQDNDGKDIA